VRWGHKADVVNATVLQLKHHLGEPLVRDLVLSLLPPRLRDLVVLAIDAAKIAVAKEDVSCTTGSGQTGLFAKMSGVGGYDREPSRVTRSDFVLQAIIAAVLWTYGAGCKQIFQRTDAAMEFTGLQQR